MPSTGPMTPALYFRLREEMYREIISEIGGASTMTVIPSGGSISGTLSGPVFCEGNVTVDADVTVQGDLFVVGDLTNTGGHGITVTGDFFVENIDCNPAVPGGVQGNIVVGGDLVFGNTFNFQQDSGGAPAEVRVDGNVIANVGGGTGFINASGGAEGSEGAYFYVNGSMYVNGIAVNGAGSSTPGTAAGDGGDILVYGDLMVQSALNAQGGLGTDTDAGNGGTVTVWGAANSGDADWFVQGGDATNGNAGNGGSIYIHSNASISRVNSSGGDCTSDDENHRSGSGGITEIDGNFACDSTYTSRGGQRSGTLTTGNSLASPNGGELFVYGTASFEDLFMEGGSVFTTGFSPHSGGNGGSVTIDGNVSVIDDFQLNGGSNNAGNAGSGGNATIQGNFFVDDDLEFRGGNATDGNGGNGGTLDVYGDLSCGDTQFYGGSVLNGNAGFGGNIFCDGTFTITSYLEIYGGDCSSTDNTHSAGNGGALNCRGLSAEGVVIDIRGGTRSGSTTVAGSTNVPNAGSVTVRGNAVVASIDGYGGDAAADYPTSAGGNGANISVEGSLIAISFSLNGGNSVGPAGGGIGGTLNVQGLAVINGAYDATGGQSNDSAAGGDAGANGGGGSGFFSGGLACETWNVTDGAGAGSAATANVTLRFAGSVTVGSISMTNRAGCVIDTINSGAPAVVKVNAMTAKTTFNDQAGVATGDLSGFLADSVFFSDSAGGWYYAQGTAI